MPYCTLADIEDGLSREKIADLTDDENLGGTFEARVEKAIEDSDILIDSYIRGKFTLPLVSPSADLSAGLRRLSVDFSIWHLYQRRRLHDMPEKVEKQYDRNIAYLRDVAAGRVLLDAPAATPNTGSIFKTNKDANSRVFNSDVMGGY